MARMQELRREASRYREAHVGRARDSWVTLSRAIRNRRRRDLKMLTLPLDQLAARLPPSRPTKISIAAEVASLNSFAESSSAAESSDQNDDYDSSDSKSGRLQMLQQESINRLDRLKLVVDKMDEVREQRDMLALQVQEKMKRECKDAEEQDDLDLIGSLKGSKDDIEAAIKKKLHTRHRNLVNLIEQNIHAQLNILEGVRLAYSRASSERRAYANAIQRRRNAVSSLLEAYENHIVSNGGTPTEISNHPVTALPNSGLLPDSVLAEKCAKGLEFYKRLLINVSKLLQRVKGTCQVQTEQRDQMIQQHRQWEAEAQQSDDDQISTVGGGLDDLLASVSGNITDSDHQQEDLAALIDNFGNNSFLNKPPAPLGGAHWDQQHNYLRRLSPLGSEQQQYFHQFRHPQVEMPLSTVNIKTAEYYKYYFDNQLENKTFVNQNSNVLASRAQLQTQPLSMSVMASEATYPLGTTTYNMISSTAVVTPINSTTTCLPSAMHLSSSVPYNYYNYQLPSVTSVTSVIGHSIPSSSLYSNYITAPSSNSDQTPTTAMMKALHLTNSCNDDKNLASPYIQSTTSNFSDAGSAAAVLQRPLQTPYTSIIGNANDSGGFNPTGMFGYHHPTSALPMQQEQFFSQHQYQQNISTTGTITSSSVGVETTGLFMQPQQIVTAGSGGLSTCVQTPLPSAVAAQSSATTSGSSTSVATNFFDQPLQYQQQSQLYPQQQHHPQLYQQQQPAQLYQHQLQPQQHQQKQQHPQLQQQQQQISQPSQHQLQQTYQQLSQLANTSISNNIYYSPLQQQQSTQLYQSQQQLQTTVGLHDSLVANQQQLPSIPSSGISSCNYYQYNQSMPMAGITPLNTTQTNLDNYYYQQPQMVTLNQQQQYYQQQQMPSVNSSSIAAAQYTPVLNLLDDDDELLSGPPPIEPEKVGCSNTASS